MNMTDWFGQDGIDTPYERSFFVYRPVLSYPEHIHTDVFSQETMLRMKRAEAFSIQKSADHYKTLIQQVNDWILLAEERLDPVMIKQYEQWLNELQMQNMYQHEYDHEQINQLNTWEQYGFAIRLRHLLAHTLNRLTSDYQPSATEEQRIRRDWQMAESDFFHLSQNVKKEYRKDDHSISTTHALEQQIDQAQWAKDYLEIQQTAKGDVGYVHYNRYAMIQTIWDDFMQLLSMKKTNNYYQDALELMQTHPSTNEIIAHLKMRFIQAKQEMILLKKQMIMTDPSKEYALHQKQWVHFQMHHQAQLNSVNWLYNLEEPEDDASKWLVDELTNSLFSVSNGFQQSNADLLRFYQQQVIGLQKQLMLMQKKEQFRAFLRIIPKSKAKSPE